MIEIHISEDGQQPIVIREQGEKTKVRISPTISSGELLAKLEIELDSDEYQSFLNLWSNDAHPRVFNQQGNYLVIKDQ